jgi:Tol biopolymer transport system component
MTGVPREFPIPEEVFERQCSLLTAHVHARRGRSGFTRRRLIAVAAVILVGGLLVTPALGIGGRVVDLFRGTGPSLDGDLLRSPRWSPDGRRIAFTGGGFLWVMNADGGDLRKLELARYSVFDWSWSPDGRKIAFIEARSRRRDLFNNNLYVVNADGSGRRLVTRRARAFSDAPAWSPDGRRIAFQSLRDGLGEVYVMNLDGTGQRNLTRNPATDFGPVWSPDGRRIANTSDRDGNGEVYVMNLDGTGQRNLTRSPAGDVARVWLPVGRKIAFDRFRSGRSWADETYTMNADGSEQRKWGLGGQVWSPDGRRIVFTRGGFLSVSDEEIHVMNADGSARRRLTRNSVEDRSPAWSPDGRRIVFISNRDGTDAIYVMNVDGSGQKRLTP